MRVFVAGATGVIGRRVVEQAARAGHDVTGVSRSDGGRDLLLRSGGRPVAVDLFDASAVAAAAAGHDVVVNLATSIPTGARALRTSAWDMTARLRQEASQHLVDAALSTAAGRYIQESLTLIYQDAGDQLIDEASPVEPHRLHLPVMAAEEQTRRFTRRGGAGVALRFGAFYGADAAHTADELAMARRGFAATIGRTDGFRPVVHLDDAAAAVVASLDVAAGVYNVVDDVPLTRDEHAAALAAAVGVPRLRHPPAVLGRIGNLAALARSQRVSNAKLRASSPWQPRYPSAVEGWRAVVAAEADAHA